MSPEQISAIFAGVASILTGLSALALAVVGKRASVSEQARAELTAREAKVRQDEQDLESHDEAVAVWRVKIRAYIVRLRELLADKGVTVDDPPPYPERPGRQEQK